MHPLLTLSLTHSLTHTHTHTHAHTKQSLQSKAYGSHMKCSYCRPANQHWNGFAPLKNLRKILLGQLTGGLSGSHRERLQNLLNCFPCHSTTVFLNKFPCICCTQNYSTVNMICIFMRYVYSHLKVYMLCNTQNYICILHSYTYSMVNITNVFLLKRGSF